jgi:prepilin-type N-terminal cleavage/methylation domain-containing protein
MMGARRSEGFTLIELLVVIIIIAILAAIGIPTFLGQRQEAQDAAAYTLVRNALTAVQTAFVETGDYTELTEVMMEGVETSVTWIEGAADLVVVGANPEIDGSAPADSSDDEVIFYAQSATVIDLASRSASGNWFGIQIDSLDITQSGYVEVKIIDGEGYMGW